ncbi:MAG: octanoyl-[GcvH]:protein N-octanoyltransferase [Haloarculaceae archaeon]|jgi:octanoyl-[GcvH]:protein N-octanoyltransferase
MRVLRGRAGTIEADRAVTDHLVERAVERGESALRVWTPHPQVAFGRRDATAAGYDRARELAREAGYPPVERSVGGRAVAYTGSTVALVHADPAAERTAIEARYDRATDRLRTAFDRLGVDASEGEPAGAFCPGTHSLRAAGKVAGLAQRVRKEVAVVGGVVVVRDHEAIADVLEPVYAALDVPFDRDAVGSVARAGGDGGPEAVCRAIESAFGSEDASVEQVSETEEPSG